MNPARLLVLLVSLLLLWGVGEKSVNEEKLEDRRWCCLFEELEVPYTDDFCVA